MIQETITLEHALKVLNDALEIDPEGIDDLVANRVPCSDALGKHPTIQVLADDATILGERVKVYSVGLLGILNGLFGADKDQWGTIAGVFEIECPSGCELPDGHRVQPGPCPICGTTTKMGKLTKFVDIGRR